MINTTYPSELTTERKALTINLDSEIYGTFAEIGAGQEVARQFFKAGGAAGTIAKSMSAYDMKFSDEIYGKTQRYVSRDRLLQMLEHEFNLLTARLAEERGANTCFFVYANTVAAASYHRKGESHGWMGIRFQMSPGQPPNDLILHVRMLDNTNSAQQEALGVFGVNFIYATFILREDPDQFINSLADNLGTDRIEVDRLEFNGPHLQEIDNRILGLQLVRHGLTNAVMYGPDKSLLLPSEALYKKAVLVERGSFRPLTHVHVDMLHCANAQFLQVEKNRGVEVLNLLEITMNNLLSGGEIDYQDFLARVDICAEMGYTVLISNYMEFFRLSAYFRRYTSQMIGIVLGVNLLVELFRESYYQKLEGGILEAFGRLFKESVRLYVYPMSVNGYNRYLGKTDPSAAATTAQRVDPQHEETLITAHNVQVNRHLRSLYAYLLENHFIEPVVDFDPSCMDIFSKDTLNLIRQDDPSWDQCVPKPVADFIRKHNLWK